jgi:hypothetical protein
MFKLIKKRINKDKILVNGRMQEFRVERAIIDAGGDPSTVVFRVGGAWFEHRFFISPFIAAKIKDDIFKQYRKDIGVPECLIDYEGEQTQRMNIDNWRYDGVHFYVNIRSAALGNTSFAGSLGKDTSKLLLDGLKCVIKER